jgi:hypothetical protein
VRVCVCVCVRLLALVNSTHAMHAHDIHSAGTCMLPHGLMHAYVSPCKLENAHTRDPLPACTCIHSTLQRCVLSSHEQLPRAWYNGHAAPKHTRSHANSPQGRRASWMIATVRFAQAAQLARSSTWQKFTRAAAAKSLSELHNVQMKRVAVWPVEGTVVSTCCVLTRDSMSGHIGEPLRRLRSRWLRAPTCCLRDACQLCVRFQILHSKTQIVTSHWLPPQNARCSWEECLRFYPLLREHRLLPFTGCHHQLSSTRHCSSLAQVRVLWTEMFCMHGDH